MGFFLDKFFSGLGGIEIGERWRDFRVLFLWLNSIPTLSIVLSRRERERKRERERERNIIKEIF